MKDITAKEAMGIARSIADAVKRGSLSYEQGKEQAQPYIDIVNKRGKEISKEYGRRYAPLTYTRLLRM